MNPVRYKLNFVDVVVGIIALAAFMLLVIIVVAGIGVLVRGTWLYDVFIFPALIIGFLVATFTTFGIAAMCKGYFRGEPRAWWEGDEDTR